jgi:hypothetical protein
LREERAIGNLPVDAARKRPFLMGEKMVEIVDGVSWLAVIVGAVAAFILGWLWYGPLFGKQWAAGNNVELGTAANMPMGAMASQAIGLLLVSWFVAVIAPGVNLVTLILAVIAFGVLNASSAMFIKKPTNVIVIDFVYLIAVAAIMFVAQMIL